MTSCCGGRGSPLRLWHNQDLVHDEAEAASSEQKLVQTSQPHRLAAGEGLGVEDAHDVAPEPRAVADRVDHAGPPGGLVVDELRADSTAGPRSWRRAVSEMSTSKLGRSTIRRWTLK